MFEDQFTTEELERHFDFYEPFTVHESSLSPCLHSIQAAVLDRMDQAYEFYLRTSRLDLDDYNNDTEDGCHITSMAGTWMTVVKGFGGMRNSENMLHFSPFIPNEWKAFAFKVRYRGALLEVKVGQERTEIINHSDKKVSVEVDGKIFEIEPMAALVQ